ncbi:MAG TPA: carbon starvation CstA family protein [Elusimicrobiota bacterium]|nr:carbon starvation CstA family protein [Elusimicrobiota bacterium]
MSLALIATVCTLLFVAAYFLYGRLAARLFKLDPQTPTPAKVYEDGVDFVPAKASLLLGQHFSAIAAAGPIVGPILAGIWFGWLPALLWIVLGSIFFGAVHDFSSLIGSVRHKARSVAEIVKDHIGPRAYKFFLAFIWLTLVYVIASFTDITSSSFAETQFGGGVASSSALYLVIGVAMGFCLYRLKMPLWMATLLFVPLVGLSIWFGQAVPLRMPGLGPCSPQMVWNFIILGYCFLASVIPMWILLQPRGYLGGFFLYGALLAGVVGVFLSGDRVQYPAFIGFTSLKGLPLFPMLFVTVACGACSGFHGLVSSGTTSKQVAREPDCHLVGYGGMLLEGFVAVVALSTVMLLAPGDVSLSASPDRIYANGLSHFVEQFGIDPDFARSFALLAFATFIYDTLDVATRLGRYVLQELTGWKGWKGGAAATVLTLILPAYFVSATLTDAAGNAVPAWKLFWTIFGTSNQLLAGLTLLGLTVWLKRTGKPWWMTAVPTVFMMTMTFWSLALTVLPWLRRIFDGQIAWDVIPAVGLVLLALSLMLLWETFAVLRSPNVLETEKVSS